MISVFKCTELIAVLSLMLVYQPQGFPSRYFHVAAAATTDTTRPSDPPSQNSVVTVAVTVAIATATPSSAAPTSAPISSNTTVSSSALPTSTLVPVIPALTPGQLPNSFPQNTTVTSGINFDTSWQECKIFRYFRRRERDLTLRYFFFLFLQSIA